MINFNEIWIYISHSEKIIPVCFCVIIVFFLIITSPKNNKEIEE
jgi:hypothetical protein